MGTQRFHPEKATHGDCAQRNTHTHTQIRANKKKSPFSPSFNMKHTHTRQTLQNMGLAGGGHRVFPWVFKQQADINPLCAACLCSLHRRMKGDTGFQESQCLAYALKEKKQDTKLNI